VVNLAAAQLGDDGPKVGPGVTFAQPRQLYIREALDADLQVARPGPGAVIGHEVPGGQRRAVVVKTVRRHGVEELVIGLGEELSALAPAEIRDGDLAGGQTERRLP
jgi:hypothetical protein